MLAVTRATARAPRRKLQGRAPGRATSLIGREGHAPPLPHLSANRCRPAVLMRNVRRSRPSLQLVSLRERVQGRAAAQDRAGAQARGAAEYHSEKRGAPQSFEGLRETAPARAAPLLAC